MLVTLSADWKEAKKTMLGYHNFWDPRVFVNCFAPAERAAKKDFIIKTSDGEVVEVSKEVVPQLKHSWSFFKALMNPIYIEAHENEVYLDTPKRIVEIIVRYWRDEELVLQPEDAIELLVKAEMYALDGLLILVIEYLKTADLSFEQAVLVWQKCVQLSKPELRSFMAKRISSIVSAMIQEREQEKIRETEDEELPARKRQCVTV